MTRLAFHTDMFTLRCTKKLLPRLATAPELNPPPPDTAPGDWYAHLIRVGRAQMVLAVSERSLLPVVVPAKDGHSLARRISEALEPVLLLIGVPAEDIVAERRSMASSVVGRTANRRVLGSLNELGSQLELVMRDVPERPLLEQALWLAETPLKLIEYRDRQIWPPSRAWPDQRGLAPGLRLEPAARKA